MQNINIIIPKEILKKSIIENDNIKNTEFEIFINNYKYSMDKSIFFNFRRISNIILKIYNYSCKIDSINKILNYLINKYNNWYTENIKKEITENTNIKTLKKIKYIEELYNMYYSIRNKDYKINIKIS